MPHPERKTVPTPGSRCGPDALSDGFSFLRTASRGFDGTSLLPGADNVVGEHKLIGGVQYYTGELSENSGYDFRRTILAAACEYKLAKKAWLYFAATHLIGGGSLKKAADDLGLTKTTQVMAGVNLNG